MDLIIVESPSKAKTISKYLKGKYKVDASGGHVRDLPERSLGVKITDNFEPRYEITPSKKDIIKRLTEEAKKAGKVYLATDPDREGEAISWHLQTVLGMDKDGENRVEFNEISPKAVENALKNPRKIDYNLVDAQQARRVLDRLVGYKLSPLLNNRIQSGLSAGRVQSVALRLIVDREREIAAFVPEEYYVFTASLQDKVQKYSPFRATYQLKKSGRSITAEQAAEVEAKVRAGNFVVTKVKSGITKSHAPAPFTTSSLQQDASNKFGMTSPETMLVAQHLYEGMDVGGDHIALVTYIRTDSTRISAEAGQMAREFIKNTYGEQYVPAKPNIYATKKGAQDAHEAIRPTYLDRRAAGETPQERRLYDLIWKRTVASQMADAELEKTTAQIAIGNRTERFVASGEVVTFDGFLRLYMESHDDDNRNDATDETLLPPLTTGTQLVRAQITATQRFAQRPPRYSEASLVKHLEELGIGRPSTYAPTISTVITRGYVVKEDREGVRRNYTVLTLSKAGNIKRTEKSETTGAEKNKLFPTDIGMLVTDYLAAHFPSILDYNFTAKVEKEFDEIAEGTLDWRQMLAAFYGPFHEHVGEAEGETEYVRSERLLGVDPKTGKNVYARVGKFGPMVQLGDSPAPAQKGSEPVPESEKPQYASLLKGQMVATITLDEALALFELPRTLGQYEGKTVVAAIGRFGPYIRHDGKFVSLKVREGDDPYTVTLDRAIQLIEEKREAERNRVIRVYEAEDIQLLNGRWGPYIAHAGANYKIPKSLLANREAASLTLDELKALIAEQQTADGAAAPKRTARRTASSRTVSATKSATKTAAKSNTTKTKKATAKTESTAKSSGKSTAKK